MKRAIGIVGTFLVLGGAALLLYHSAPELPAIDWRAPGVWLGMVSALLAYLASQAAATEAWRGVLGVAGVSIRPTLAWSQALVSQIGKYVPGNVVHLVGRAALARRDGVPTGALAAAMVLEVGITLAVGLLVAALLLLVRPEILTLFETAAADGVARTLLPVALAAGLACLAGLGALVVRARLTSVTETRISPRLLLRPVLLQVANFAILGASLWSVACAVAPEAVPDPLVATLVFALSWTAGFVMPGAPGGIGVREGLIALGLTASLGAGPALAVALLHRAVTVAGDLMTFAIGWQMRRRSAVQTGPRNRPDPAIIAAD